MIKHKIIGLMAADPNGVVGLNGRLPWDYPEDLEFFRTQTRGQIVIAGRKTVEGLPPHFFQTKDTICLTRNPNFRTEFERVTYGKSIEDAVGLSNSKAQKNDQKTFMVGGAKLAESFLRAGVVDEFILTKIKQPHAGDSVMDLSLLNGNGWHEQEILKQTADFDIVRLCRHYSCAYV